MIWPVVMSWAMPRPATIRMSVATNGWMPITATSIPFQRPQSIESPRAAAMAMSTRREAVLIVRLADQEAGAGAGDGRDGADGEIDPAGRDHERHPDRDEHQRRAEADDVDQAPVQMPAAHVDREEPGRDQEVGEQERDDREQRPDQAMPRHAAAPPAIVCSNVSTVTPSLASSATIRRSRRTSTL